MRKILLFCLITVLGTVIVACGSVYEPEPVGIGRDFSELKRSPCACLKVELAPDLPQWFS